MEKKRLLYIDNIRLWMIILVVVFHVAITYGGSHWYYQESAQLTGGEETFFGFFTSFTQGFFMGFLFLIAGYFVPGAYDRKGVVQFIKDRVIRLGIPVLVYMFAVDPFLEFVLVKRYVLAGQDFFSYWITNIANGHFLTGTGPLWFALALLIFTLVYAFIRLAAQNLQPSNIKIKPSAGNMLLLVFVIAAFAFLIRIWLPLGIAFYNMILGNFAQYIVLFIVGVLAYRQDLFSKISYKFGLRLLYTAPVWGFIGWGAMMVGCQVFWGSDYALFSGGATPQSALYALWESFTAVAMDFALLALFREKINKQGRLGKMLSDNAFAVYVFHAPVIVWISLLFMDVHWMPGLKFLALIPICLPVCFAVAYGLRKIPLLKKVI